MDNLFKPKVENAFIFTEKSKFEEIPLKAVNPFVRGDIKMRFNF
jgi:hypothetical protein